MFKKVTILLGALIVLSLQVKASNNELFTKANEYYKKGAFDTAVVCYESIVKSGQESAELYFNLGNSYFKLKQNARAIVNFERAHKLSPEDEAISANLELANALLTDKINVLPEFFLNKWYKKVLCIYTADKWAKISISAFIFTLVLLLVYFFSRFILLKKISFWFAVIALGVSATSLSMAYKQEQLYISEKSAIVITASVTVKGSPDEAGTDLFVIHDGLKVEIIDQVGNWRNIKLPDGNKGWLKLSDIEVI